MVEAPITWTAQEFEVKDRSSQTKKILILGGILFLLALLLKSALFAIFVILASFVFIIIGARRPRDIIYSLTPEGIEIDSAMHSYKEFESFWIQEEELGNKLLLKHDQLIVPFKLILLANDIDPEHVRELMRSHLEEVPHNRTFIDSISDYLGF